MYLERIIKKVNNLFIGFIVLTILYKYKNYVLE